jgi:hypothetical protein
MFDNDEELRGYLPKQFPILEGKPEAGEWYRLPVPGAISADGLPYWGFLRKGTEPGLIVYFSGGGVSLNAYMAARPNKLNEISETFYFDGKALPYIDAFVKQGLFDPSQDNPFRNWSCILVSYTTGDFHVGNGDYPYTAIDGSPAVLHHHGYRNYRGLMEQALQFISAPTKLLITGGSAGAFGASALAADVMDYFPECRDVTCCPDSSLLLYNEWQAVAQHVWQANERIWKPLHGPNICLDWLRALYAEKGDGVRYLFICSIRDSALARYQHFLDHGTMELTREQSLQFEKDLRNMVDVLKSEIPGIGVFLLDNPDTGLDPELLGTQHTFLHTPEFFQPVKDGVSLRDWLWNAVNGSVLNIGLER